MPANPCVSGKHTSDFPIPATIIDPEIHRELRSIAGPVVRPDLGLTARTREGAGGRWSYTQ